MGQCIIMTGGYAGDSSDDCTATKSQVLEGYKAITKDSNDDAELGIMSNKGAWTNRIGVNGKAIIPAGYHNGSGYVDQAIANRGAWGTSIGINGNITIPEGYHNGQGHVTQSIATMGGQTITPSASQQTVACNGKYMTGNVVINGIEAYRVKQISSNSPYFTIPQLTTDYAQIGSYTISTHSSSVFQISGDVRVRSSSYACGVNTSFKPAGLTGATFGYIFHTSKNIYGNWVGTYFRITYTDYTLLIEARLSTSQATNSLQGDTFIIISLYGLIKI